MSRAATLGTAPTSGGRATRRALSRAIVGVLLCTGLALLAQGLWIPAKAQLAQVLLERAFAQSLASGQPVKPWPWADTAPVARISAPRLGVSDIVLSGSSGEAMAFGPTEVVAHGPVKVLAAHRDTHFAFIRDLRTGDEIVLQAIDGTLTRYRVVAFQTVRWDRFAYPAAPRRELLALATCYPFGATEHGPLRRVAWAEKIG